MSPTLQPVSCLQNVPLGRMPIFKRRSRAGIFQKTSARSSKNDVMPRILLFLDTLPPREMASSEGVTAVCSVFAHDLGYRDGNCNGLLANTDLFRSTCDGYLFLFQRHLIPFRLFTTAPDSILPCLSSKFRSRSLRSIHIFLVVFHF